MEPARPARVERRLAAILAADVAGYSRLIEADEEGTLGRLKTLRTEIIDPKIAEHHGRIVKTTGDGLLIEFASVVDALRCAAEAQAAMAESNAPLPPDRRIEFRVGIHQGDIVVEDGDIFGDGVNVAARLEGLADPGGICVSARVQEDAAGRLDLAFEDIGEHALKNIARPVRVYRVVGPAGAASIRASPGLALPDKPLIAVLPFANMSGDPEQEYFADGMVEEITTAIARLPWLFVIARNSSFTYKGRAVDVKQVARELGVRYVLEGSVRKAGNRVRITGQLIDTATGAHIWAERFEGALDDIFDLQDRVAGRVAGAIEPRLRLAEIKRASRKPTERLDAYDLYLRALAEVDKPDHEGDGAALSLLHRALAIDPVYGPAASLVAGIRHQQRVAGVPLTDEELGQALKFARLAIETGKDDPDALARSANALAMLGGETAAAISAIERALTLNPNSAYAWWVCSVVNCYANRPEAAIPAVECAMRLSPLDPIGYDFKSVLAYALMLGGRHEEAMGWIDRSLHDRPRRHFAVRVKVALCGYLGRTEEARESSALLLELNPATTIAGFKAFGSKFLSSGTVAVWEEGFRRAGLAEE